MNTSIRCDVCVVGAGPGGALLSLLLLRSGFSVTLIERSENFAREFRGEFLQPGALHIFDAIGLLEHIDKAGERVEEYRICEGNKPILTFRFDQIDGPYPFGMNVSQAFILPLLIEECRAFQGFRFLQRTTASELSCDAEGSVNGLIAALPDRTFMAVRSVLVVGADGRNSTVRKLAKLTTEKQAFQKDVLWFRVQRPAKWTRSLDIRLHDGDYVAVLPNHPDRLQIGFGLPKGSYSAMRSRGIEHLRNQISDLVPEVADEIRSSLTDWDCLSILNVQGAVAERWHHNGLVLIGDAAHTLSPIAGLGITQALKDAVLLHAELLIPLATGRVRSEDLIDFQNRRMAEIAYLGRVQRMQENIMHWHSGAGKFLRRLLYGIILSSPLKRKMIDRMTIGDLHTHVEDLQRQTASIRSEDNDVISATFTAGNNDVATRTSYPT